MEHKLSYYTVISTDDIIHNSKEHKFIFSSRTGKATLISSNLIEEIKENIFENISQELFLLMIENKILVDTQSDELEEILLENNIVIENKNGENDTLTYVIQPTANCQLGCGYCGQVHSKVTMSVDYQKLVVKRILDKCREKKYKKMLITWYGAEPILGLQGIKNISIELISFCKENSILYISDMITNGLSLKQKIFEDLVNNYLIKSYQITIDGTKEIHDIKRFSKKDKAATFDIIFDNIKEIVNSECYTKNECLISIRTNTDYSNKENIFDLLDYLKSINIHSKINFYIAAIHDWGKNGASKNILSKEEFANLEIEVLLHMVENGFFINYEELIPSRSEIVCMVVNQDSEIIDARGNIYPCWEFPYTPVYEEGEYLIGNLKFDESVYNKQAKTRNWKVVSIF